MAGICPIWGTPATVYPPDSAGEWVGVDSPRAGGRYYLPLGYTVGSQQVQEIVRPRLTTWLIDQRRMGDVAPRASHQVILAAGSAVPLRMRQKIERFFLALAAIDFDPIGAFRLAGIVDDEYRKWMTLFGAWTENANPQGGLEPLRFLEDRGWVRQNGGSGAYRLTADGLDQLDALASGRTQFDQGFVAMWFGDELRTVYDEAIEPAIRAAGYRSMRIDRKEHNNKIDDEIIAEIRRSRFLVADVTCDIRQIDGRDTAIARGGVYYEAGFAHALGMPVIWTAREGMAEHLHFDTRQYAHIIWRDAADLREKLKMRIGAALGYGPHST